MLAFLSLIIIGSNGFIYTDLKMPRSKEFGNMPWCELNLSKSHYSWSANQPPQYWVRIMFPMAPMLENFQITGCDANGTIVSKSSFIEEAYFLKDHIYISLEYWYSSCKLFYAGAANCNHIVFYGQVIA